MPTFSYNQLPFVFLALMVLMGAALYRNFVLGNQKHALLILMGIGGITRFIMTMLDPFLHDWDERFHALVAKNMMDHPFVPMLKPKPILPYRIEDWCCNHIWLHKQPLFMWQMALSMKMFGVNELALRLPGVIMGTFSIFLVYDIAKMWTKNLTIAYVAAMLFTFSFYQLEFTSGFNGMDQNNLGFGFYVTASFWAFLKYWESTKKMKWVILVGVFAGCAILIKWLTGSLIFGGWGVYLLMSKDNRSKVSRWVDLMLAFVVCCMVFMPWQWYIKEQFPAETAQMHLENWKHITEVVENHKANMWYHLEKISNLYGIYGLLFIPFGYYLIFKDKHLSRNMTLSITAMIVVLYFFFSVVVKTKMHAFVFPVHSFLWIIIATGIVGIMELAKKRKYGNHKYFPWFILMCSVVFTMRPHQMLEFRSPKDLVRNIHLHNTAIYKSLDLEHELKGYSIFNCKTFNDIDLMFYQYTNAYHWFPPANQIDSLLQAGHKLAAFKSHNEQKLPDYISKNPQIKIIDVAIK